MRWFFCLLFLSVLAVIPCYAAGPTDYYNHVIFDNSITPDYYYYSSGRAVFPSTIDLLSGSLPIEKKNFFTAPECSPFAVALGCGRELGVGGAGGQHAQPPD